jgi:predicted ATPase
VTCSWPLLAEGETTAGEVILTLAALVDANLIQTEMVAGGIIRFHMLELIRDYALQRLHAADDEEQCRRRYAAYYARLAEIVFAHFGPEPGVREVDFALTKAQELPNARGIAVGRGQAGGGTGAAARRLHTPVAGPRSDERG